MFYFLLLTRAATFCVVCVQTLFLEEEIPSFACDNWLEKKALLSRVVAATVHTLPYFSHIVTHSCSHTRIQTHIKEWCNAQLIRQLVPGEHSGHLRCEMSPAVCGMECACMHVCVLHRVTHSIGGTHDVIAGLGSGSGVLLWRPQPDVT